MNTLLIAMHQVTPAERIALYKCQGVLSLSRALTLSNIPNSVLDLSGMYDLFPRGPDFFFTALAEKVLEFDPGIVGLSTMSSNLPLTLLLCRYLKAKKPSLITVLGGQGASFCAGEILVHFPEVDAVIRGEAERAFPLFVQNILAKQDNRVDGLVIREAGGIRDFGWPEPILNLDELPVPAYEICIPPEETGERFGDYTGICLEIGRGCPYKCIYCSTSRFFKQPYRLKSVEKVIEEIRYINAVMGKQRILFNHDLLTFDHLYLEQLCVALKTHFPGLVWKCHGRFNTLNRRILEKMRDAGCNEIFLGIESCTPRMQRLIKKHLDLGHVERILSDLKGLDFKFSLSYIIGFPGETKADIKATLEHAIGSKFRYRENVMVKVNALIPFSGTEVYEKGKERLIYDDYFHSSGIVPYPREWNEVTEMIKEHPGVFSSFFHLPLPAIPATTIIKYLLIGKAVEGVLTGSFSTAYKLTGENPLDYLFEYTSGLPLPSPRDIAAGCLFPFMEVLSGLLRQGLEKRGVALQAFDAINAFELAVLKIMKHPSPDHMEIIKVNYPFEELIAEWKNDSAELIRDESAHLKGGETGNERRIMVFRNDKDKCIHYTEVSFDFEQFLAPPPE